MNISKRNKAPLCACGCGNKVSWNKDGKECWNEYIWGHYFKNRSMPKKEKRKRSKKLLGRKKSEQTVQNMIVSHNTPEYKEKYSRENASNWQGGIASLPYSQDWTKTLKESIKQRDSYRCQLCFVPQEQLKKGLHIHHIDYNKKNCAPDNLTTLCEVCHGKTSHNRKK